MYSSLRLLPSYTHVHNHACTHTPVLIHVCLHILTPTCATIKSPLSHTDKRTSGEVQLHSQYLSLPRTNSHGVRAHSPFPVSSILVSRLQTPSPTPQPASLSLSSPPLRERGGWRWGEGKRDRYTQTERAEHRSLIISLRKPE